ncbi:hypothetical protein [Aquirhabdus parva]|uniref:Uncharacterized protein n=1 Tax=Aquirhabdus parva TaxID=2283318 RepID=A0A345P906_9GAMM|nr:hypothetical protein [Aquirhabdus parva]AXI03765.1 hypothetical protein HYN46_13540 [Aquirhabdus parva]
MNTVKALPRHFEASFWCEADDLFLKENANLPFALLADLLHKPTSEIRKRRQQLGILKTSAVLHHFENMTLSA